MANETINHPAWIKHVSIQQPDQNWLFSQDEIWKSSRKSIMKKDGNYILIWEWGRFSFCGRQVTVCAWYPVFDNSHGRMIQPEDFSDLLILNNHSFLLVSCQEVGAVCDLYLTLWNCYCFNSPSHFYFCIFICDKPKTYHLSLEGCWRKVSDWLWAWC